MLDYGCCCWNPRRLTDYFYHILSENGYEDTSVKILRVLYMNATSRYEVNGFISDRFPIEYSVRQGCPLSIIMYVIVLNLLLTSLAEGLDGLKITPVFKSMPMWQYHDHFDFAGWSLGSKNGAALLSTCCKCYSQPYQIQSPTTGQKEHWD